MEKITKVIITWADAEWEYKLELDGWDAENFKEEYAEDYAIDDAFEKNTEFEEIISVKIETEEIDPAEVKEMAYRAYLEFAWELETGR